MRVGKYQVRIHNHGLFRLDGGAMFGTVPRVMWERLSPPDARNRIRLATNSLVIQGDERVALIDLGCGDKWSDKNREIFDLPSGPYIPVPGVTDVVLTHLHFDHVGGVSRSEGDRLALNYPNARHHVPRANWENAHDPNVRERASYLAENLDPIVEPMFFDDGAEVVPGLVAHRADGHTHGLAWFTFTDGQETVAFPSDLVPTSHHLPVPYVMGYDVCAERAIAEKAAFLQRAVEERWIVVFEHDPNLSAARLSFDQRGRAVVSEVIDLPDVT